MPENPPIVPLRGNPREITLLLEAWSRGDPEAFEKLLPLVYDELREMARRYLVREDPGHTLQPTALVNEVYLRLMGRENVEWKNRAHFFGSLAEMMRRVLIDHARRKMSAKRAGGVKVDLEPGLLRAGVRPAEVVALNDALSELEEIDPRQARIVKLHFFVGLTQREIARLLGISINTVQREWQKARMWLLRELSRRSPAEEAGEE